MAAWNSLLSSENQSVDVELGGRIASKGFCTNSGSAVTGSVETGSSLGSSSGNNHVTHSQKSFNSPKSER